jgi:Carbohydrate esterase, sialic acid-specific acetylesterase
MKKILPLLALALSCPLLEAQVDRFNLNLYAYGDYSAANYSKVTLEAGESAGVGTHNVTGWQNYAVPWHPGSPSAPFTLTSNLGATATFTLNDARNGSTFDSTPNTTVTGGNADLMNSHANGTEDPYDGSNLFDMKVTGIPYQVYDLIVYLGANQAQFGDGTGKLVINGEPQQNFTLTSGEFSSFTEITNATTPGNYIIFRGLRNPSLTLKVWGNGFNHIGPTGFQIVKDISGVIPPGPAGNPNPPNASVGHAANTDLSWTGGLDATSRNVYFGTNPSPGASELKGNQTATTYDPGNLTNGTYYWRIDEVNADGTTPGPIWSFSVGSPAKAFRPMPWNGMSAVATNVGMLKWVAGASTTASSHDVYFGTDSTPDATEFIGNQSGTTYNPGPLSPATTYYWRIDQVNAQGTTTGDVWTFTTPNTGSNKVKVFILAGQSNMEGQGEMTPGTTPGTLQNMYDSNPVAYAHLKSGSNWAVRSDVWAWFRRDGGALQKGDLTAGYGANTSTIGPELQFGHLMGDHYGQKVLLIKTAWGGKSLRTDFRPPSSGWSKDVPLTNGDEGYYFKVTLDTVVDVLANLQTYFPTHNSADGFEIAGFGWHQGWNDRVTPAFSAEYEVNMANFIRDVRTAVGVPAMPFVIGTTGMGGDAAYTEVELAQLQMENFTAYPAFNGNVAVVDTKSFWFPVNQSPADQGYHWNRNAASYYKIGNAMGLEMKTLVGGGGEDNIPPSPDPMTWASVPVALGGGSITMTATSASDGSGVEYFFDETSNNPGGTDSGWQDSPVYTDSGLTPGTSYTYQVKARDKSITHNETTNSSAASATAAAAQAVTVNVDFGSTTGANYSGVGVAPDLGTTWNAFNSGSNGAGLNPSAVALLNSTGSASGISMSLVGSIFAWNATPAVNNLVLDYAFVINTTGTVNLTGLTPAATFDLYLYGQGDNASQISTFTLNAGNGGATATTSGSDRSVLSATSVKLSGTADGSGNVSFTWTPANPAVTPYAALNGFQLVITPTDSTPPTPNPMTWASAPAANSESSITMTATTASDPGGVEYFFDETSGNPGGNDSGWQDSPIYTDTGLTPGTSYTYTVTARDKSTNPNSTAASAPASATTVSAFAGWAAGPFPSGQPLTNPDPELDYDGGSLPTGIEWVVGGDPTNGSDDAALAPTIQAAAEPGFHTITYHLSNEAAADGRTDAFIEYSTNLGPWTKAIHNGDTVRITTTPGPTFATVEVKLKDTLAPDGRLFAHLKATVTP